MMNPYDVWWSIALNSLAQQFLLGFPVSSCSVLLAIPVGNVLLLKQNIFYITIKLVIIRLLYVFNQTLFLVKEGTIHKSCMFR